MKGRGHYILYWTWQ